MVKILAFDVKRRGASNVELLLECVCVCVFVVVNEPSRNREVDVKVTHARMDAIMARLNLKFSTKKKTGMETTHFGLTAAGKFFCTEKKICVSTGNGQ